MLIYEGFCISMDCLNDSARLVCGVAITLAVARLMTGLAGALFLDRLRLLVTQVGAVVIATGGAVLAVALYAVAGYEVVTIGSFGAPWDLDPAMRLIDGELKSLDFLVAFPQYPIAWDGEVVVQHGVGRWSARQLWLWTGQTGTLSQLDPPVTIPQPNLPQ